MKAIRTFGALILAAALMAGGIWLVGEGTMHRGADADPMALRTGALLAGLRNGEVFALSDAFPEAWDEAQFSRLSELSSMERHAVIGFDRRFEREEDVRLLLLWQRDQLVTVVSLPQSEGYPRFAGTMNAEAFALSREDAQFLCTFIEGEDGRGGYYLCEPLGEAA